MSVRAQQTQRCNLQGQLLRAQLSGHLAGIETDVPVHDPDVLGGPDRDLWRGVRWQLLVRGQRGQ